MKDKMYPIMKLCNFAYQFTYATEAAQRTVAKLDGTDQ
jgi:hypothetical protein